MAKSAFGVSEYIRSVKALVKEAQKARDFFQRLNAPGNNERPTWEEAKEIETNLHGVLEPFEDRKKEKGAKR
jgi:hypothetical protein